MIGAAIIAGSNLHFLARMGSKHPTILAIIIVPTNDRDTTKANCISLYISTIRRPFATANVAPTISETLNSFQTILRVSENCNSSTAKPRITSVEL